MYRNHTVAVVVPAYNEAGLVGGVIDTMPEFVDLVYVVDDRSTDGTWDEICRHAERANTRTESVVAADGGVSTVVSPIRNPENRGVGYSITNGYRHALADGADVVAVMNGDGQMDPDVLSDILDPIVDGRADYTKGNRLISNPHALGMSNWRLFGNWSLTLLTRISSGYWSVSDSQNGYTAISRRALETIDLDSLYERYGFLNDVLTKLNVHGLRVADVPHPARYGNERSGISYPSFIVSVSMLLLRNFLWRMRQKYVVTRFHPTVLYYALGLGGTTLGVSVGLLALAAFAVGGPTPVDTRVVVAAVVLGAFFSALAVVTDARQSEHLEVRLSD